MFYGEAGAVGAEVFDGGKTCDYSGPACGTPDPMETQMTRAQIIADITAMRLTPRQTALAIALTEFQSGLPVDQECPDCGRAVQIAGLPEGAEHPRAWVIRCGCRESSARGL